MTMLDSWTIHFECNSNSIFNWHLVQSISNVETIPIWQSFRQSQNMKIIAIPFVYFVCRRLLRKERITVWLSPIRIEWKEEEKIVAKKKQLERWDRGKKAASILKWNRKFYTRISSLFLYAALSFVDEFHFYRNTNNERSNAEKNC